MDQPAISAKKKVEKEVLEVIIKNLNAGTLKVNDAKLVAKLTLSEVKRIEMHEETVADFYKNLSEKYPVFLILYTKIKGDLAASRELSAHREALAAIDSGKIDEAHKIARGAVAQTANETSNAK